MPAEEVRRVKLGGDEKELRALLPTKKHPWCVQKINTHHTSYTHTCIHYITYFIPTDTSHTYISIHYIHIHTVHFLAFNTK